MIAMAILGCAIAAGVIVIKVLDAPSQDEPTDQFSQPFGDVPHLAGDFVGWDHGECE